MVWKDWSPQINLFSFLSSDLNAKSLRYQTPKCQTERNPTETQSKQFERSRVCEISGCKHKNSKSAENHEVRANRRRRSEAGIRKTNLSFRHFLSFQTQLMSTESQQGNGSLLLIFNSHHLAQREQRAETFRFLFRRKRLCFPFVTPQLTENRLFLGYSQDDSWSLLRNIRKTIQDATLHAEQEFSLETQGNNWLGEMCSVRYARLTTRILLVSDSSHTCPSADSQVTPMMSQN